MITPPINYSLPSAKRWAVLISKLVCLPLEEKRQLLKEAVNYRSGESLINTVYMGSMATASLCSALGGMYGKDSVISLIESAKEENIDAGIRTAIHTIEYMLANPISKCPCCGQIVKGVR